MTVLPPYTRSEWDAELAHLAARELWIVLLEVIEPAVDALDALARWMKERAA